MSATSSSASLLPASAPPRRVPGPLRRLGVAAATLLALGLVWEAGVRAFSVPSFILPAPSLVWTQTAAVGPAILVDLRATLTTVLGGYLAAILVAFPIAVAISSSRAASSAIYPLLLVKQSIPVVALAPILTVVMGTGEAARITITALIAIFPLVVGTATGLSSAPKELMELSASMGASWWKRLVDIRLPSAVPHIFSALKVAIGLSLIGAVVAEFVAAERGLGYLIYTSTAYFRLPVAFGAMGVLSVTGMILFQAVVLAERVFFPWSVGRTEEAA
jgi:NitT/TauT family transport system permease protein